MTTESPTTEANNPKRQRGLSPAHCSAAGVESEVCEYCEGVGSISYNPNLNPNVFLATATTRCRHCDGTGSVEKAKPQPNAKLTRDG